MISHQVPKQFPSISHQNPFVSIKFPKKSHQILFVLIKFSESSHQIPLVPINNPSISFCSHQVPKRFPSNFSCSHQNPFVPMALEGRQMSTKGNGETRERLGQSTKRSVAVRGQAGRGATMAGRRLPGAAEQKFRNFCLSGFVAGRFASRVAVCRASS